MTDDERLASLHAAQTQQAIALGRIDERLTAIQRSLERHMADEHGEFRKALEGVTAVQADIRDIHQAARVTRWLAMAVASLAAGALWLYEHIKFR